MENRENRENTASAETGTAESTKSTESSEAWPVRTLLVKVTDRKTGVRYLEERYKQYDPALGRERVIGSHRTGRKIRKGETEEVLCRPRAPSGKRARGSASQQHGSCQPSGASRPADVCPQAASQCPADTGAQSARAVRVQATDIVAWAGRESGLADAVRSAWPARVYSGCADRLLSVAQYFVLTGGGSVEMCDIWQCSHTLPAEMSSEDCYELFDQLGADESGMRALVSSLARLSGSEPGVLYDTVTRVVSSVNLGLDPLEGRMMTEERQEAFRLLTICSARSGLPILSDMQHEDSPDVSAVCAALERMQDCCPGTLELVLSDDYFTKEKLSALAGRHIGFTLGGSLEDAERAALLVSAAGGRVGVHCRLAEASARCPFDQDIVSAGSMELPAQRLMGEGSRSAGAADRESGQGSLNLHFYLDTVAAEQERQALQAVLDSLAARLTAGDELSAAEEGLAQRCLTVRKVRGRKVSAAISEEGVAEESRDYGIFVLVSTVHRDPWEALRLCRTRAIIESSYQIPAFEPDSRGPGFWNTRNLRGRELCRMVALGLRFFLQDAIERVREEAARRAEDTGTWGREKAGQWGEVAKWANELTLQRMLDWFDCTENVHVSNACSRYRWSPESRRRDELFLELLFGSSQVSG